MGIRGRCTVMAVLILVLAACMGLQAMAANITPTGVTSGTGGLITKGGEIGLKTVGGTYLWRQVKGVGNILMTAPVNAAGGSANPFDFTGTLGIMNNSDDFTFLDINITNADHTGTGNTVQAINIGGITGDAHATETAVKIGSGWDSGLTSGSAVTVNAAITAGYDAAAYTTITQADGAGVTINCTSDGTASITLSDPVTCSSTLAVTGKTTLGATATSTNCLLLGSGAPSGSEVTTSVANSNFVDFRCASTATSGWTHAGAFYVKAQDYRQSSSALRGYAYADAPSGASTGEISGVYGIGEQHGVGTISATGKLMGMRSRVTVPTGLTLTTGNYYGLVIETDLQSSLANCTNSAYIRFDDPNGRGKWLTYALDIANGNVGTATSNMVKTDLGDAATAAGLKVRINGTTYWVQLATYSP